MFRKYLHFFTNSLAQIWEYRVNLVGRSIVEMLSIASFMILWIAVLKTHDNIGGYTIDQALIYYLAIPIAGILTSVYLDSFPDKIKSGQLSNNLLRPYNIFGELFSNSLATKFNNILLTAPIYLLIITILVANYGTIIKWDLILLSICAGLLGYFLNFFMDLVVGLSAFWLDDVWAFRHLKTIIFSVFGGVAFPFAFLPDSIRFVLEKMPFQYMYRIPVDYFLGKRSHELLLYDLTGLLIWTLLFIGLSTIMWRKGLKKYGAFGG